jgi:hypothetical protein
MIIIGWLSYEVFVPYRTDLFRCKRKTAASRLTTSRESLSSTRRLTAVYISAAWACSVRRGTTNGGLHVDLTGTRWEGETLDVKTTNGGVHLSIPDGYSAHLETGTANGRVNFGFPVNAPTNERGRYSNQVSTDLGTGGPTIRVTTTNGSVHVGRPSVNE